MLRTSCLICTYCINQEINKQDFTWILHQKTHSSITCELSSCDFFFFAKCILITATSMTCLWHDQHNVNVTATVMMVSCKITGIKHKTSCCYRKIINDEPKHHGLFHTTAVCQWLQFLCLRHLVVVALCGHPKFWTGWYLKNECF